MHQDRQGVDLSAGGLAAQAVCDPYGLPARSRHCRFQSRCLLSASSVAACLGTSRSLIHVWIGQGVLRSEQRLRQSYRWVPVSEDDVARLDGKHDWSQFPTLQQVMQAEGVSREMVWNRVRDGRYVAYRHSVGLRHWEWWLRRVGADLAEHYLAPGGRSVCPAGSDGYVTQTNAL